MRELFVYYRVAPAHAEAARAAVRRFQAGLRARHPALLARLLRRPREADGLQTWMETYALADVPGGVSAAMQTEIEQAAQSLAQWIEGPRHGETFEPF